jgi:hypothetical protein
MVGSPSSFFWAFEPTAKAVTLGPAELHIDVDKLFSLVALTNDYCHWLHANMEWEAEAIIRIEVYHENIHILAWDLLHR